MRAFRIIGRSIRDAFKSVFRNFSLSMASISCTAVTLIIVAVAILLTYNVNSITKDLKDALTIVVYVDRDASEDDIAKVKIDLENINNVDTDSVRYESKDDIKNELIKDEQFAELFNVFDTNPIDSRYIIRVKDVTKMADTASRIKEFASVTKVEYGESIVNRMLPMFDIVKNVSIIAVIALIVVTCFLIGNTIKITIFSRRQEINIMRLVGTSNAVIKLPFLIEGFFLGIIGAIIPILITIFGYTFLYEFMGGKLLIESMTLVQPDTIIYPTSLVILIIAGIVGMFGSLNAVRRYLKIWKKYWS